jgi:hypothetical protein
MQHVASKFVNQFIGIAVILFLLQMFLFMPNKGMSPVWSIAYFSGAKEWSLEKGWLYNKAETDVLKEMKGYEIYTYEFDTAPDQSLSRSSINSTGFLYIVWFSQLIFPFLGPIGSVAILQIIAHLFFCFLIIRRINDPVKKVLFSFLYMANPVVVYFVSFPFYYFWQAIPGMLFILYYLDKEQRSSKWFLDCISAFLLVIILASRPTVLFLVIGILFYFLARKQYARFIIHVVLIGVLLTIFNAKLNFTKNYGPWHTAFIGWGAYPNQSPHLFNLSDDRGYDRYKSLTGKQLDASIEGNYNNDENVRLDYLSVLKKDYFEMVKNSPITWIRNGVLNFLQGFSVGYIPRLPFIIHLLVAFSGLLVLVFLLYRKQFWGAILIGLSHLSFTPYFPPIPAYVYGSYAIIIFFLVWELIDMLKGRNQSNELI